MPFIKRDGATISFETPGNESAPPVLLLHDIAADLRAWMPAARELARDFWLILPDLRGHGLSRRPDDATGAVDMATYADDILAVLDSLEVELAAVGGTGFGTAVALRLAAEHPGRVAALVIDGDIDPPAEPRPADEVATRGVLQRGRRVAPGIEDDYLARGLVAKFRWVDCDGIADAMEAWRTGAPTGEALAGIRVPVMLLEGDTPHGLAGMLPDARRVSIRGGGREMAATRAAAVARELGRFFAAIEDGRPVGEHVTL